MTLNGQPCETEREQAIRRQAEMYLYQRDAALECLDRMVKLVDKVGGFLSGEHQSVRLDAIFLLETNGVRPQSRTWRGKP